MKIVLILFFTAWIFLAGWLGTLVSDQPESLPSDFGFSHEPPADYDGEMEPDCQVKILSSLKK